MLKFYSYNNCSSCRKARKWLEANRIPFDKIAIREHPPTLKELEQVHRAKGNIKQLFNTSGMDYRQMGMKDTLPTLTNPAALDLLANNGNLIKRPFVVGDDISLVGFKEAEWQQQLA